MTGWNQAALALPDDEVDRNDRFRVTCATSKCDGLPTHAVAWDYVTGRRGRVSRATRKVCTKHAEAFAKKHDIAISGTYEQGSSILRAAVDAMTDGGPPVDLVRVHRSSHGMQWYLERRRGGSTSLFAITQHWLAGATADAPLSGAIRAAEIALSNDPARLVPVDDWRIDDDQALVRVTAAERSPNWAGKHWDLTVTCDGEGMWTLTRILDKRFPPVVDRLGFHNMSIERALRVANQLLDEDGWIAVTTWAATATTPLIVSRQAFHPDQAANPQGGDQ